jgi:hypothetical protein
MLHCRAVPRSLFLAPLIALAIGCNIPERVSRLEKETKEMQSERNRATDYDLQAKCSKDARGWFNENWSSDKDTILLDFSNHYNKKENRCFILVERHYNSKLAGPGGASWTNHMSLWNVYENSEYGDFAENHYTYYKPKVSSSEEVIMCEMLGQKCKTVDEFNALVRPYMND